MIPTLVEIVTGEMWLDGGSILLNLRDRDQVEHRLRLVQHIFSQPAQRSGLKGRLYFDDRLVRIRSADEAAIMQFLRTARITGPSSPWPKPVEPTYILGDDLKEYFEAGSRSAADALRYLVRNLVTLVDSDEYALF